MGLKIISYNVNGIRAAIKRGFFEWLEKSNPDILVIQETKAKPEQIDVEGFAKLGYKAYINSAQKAGYSGVAIFSKKEADQIFLGMGNEKFDSEGRVIRADYGDFTLVNTYFPSGSSGDARQAFKMEFLAEYQEFIENLKKERSKLVVSGDYNICHKAIDIHNPVSNKNSSGFLPEEREWLSKFVELGFVDTFRARHSEADRYSWWSYRFKCREKNLGWRIDYNMATENLSKAIENADILDQVFHSDHCPVLLELDVKL